MTDDQDSGPGAARGMRRRTFLALGAGALAAPKLARAAANAHGFRFEALADPSGEIRLGDYAGRPVMVVNTASRCGFTPQYDGLQALWSASCVWGVSGVRRQQKPWRKVMIGGEVTR